MYSLEIILDIIHTFSVDNYFLVKLNHTVFIKPSHCQVEIKQASNFCSAKNVKQAFLSTNELQILPPCIPRQVVEIGLPLHHRWPRGTRRL